MTPFAATFHWDDRQISERASAIECALDVVSPCCVDDRRVVTVPGGVLAAGLKVTVPGETLDSGLLVDWREQWAAIGDVRLYDREDVAARSGIEAANRSDLEILARGYRRLGPSAMATVAGDFAFAIWDWRERRLQAVRDHFGIRSIFHRVRNDGIDIAGSVRQLLALQEDDRVIDDVMALGYLTGRIHFPERTFFSSIRAVRPSGWLDATSTGLRQSDYWRPTFDPFPGSYRDAVEEWQRRFRNSVRSRLLAQRPVAIHLSGGFDSSSIVGAAHDALKDDDYQGGRPVALSASFQGFSCDERRFQEAVIARCSSFDWFVWDGREVNPDDFDRPSDEAPGLRQGIGRSPRREDAAMTERDCRVLLTGDGGDVLGLCYGVLGDLLLNRRWRSLVHEFRCLGEWSRIRRVARVEGEDLLRGHPRQPPPVPWLGPRLRHLAGQMPRPRFHFRGPSRVQTNIAEALAGPRAAYGVGATARATAMNGFEVRVPYLDIRLVQLVLGIPWQFRLPGGDFRRLQRDGVAPFLPDAVSKRVGKAGFNAMVVHQIKGNRSRIEALLWGGDWLSAAYVDRAMVRSTFESLMRNPDMAPAEPLRQVWRVAVFEAWLRRVLRYSAGDAWVVHGTR